MKIALNYDFWAQKSQKLLSGLGLRLHSPVPIHYVFSDFASSVTRLSYIGFFSKGPKSNNFCAKKITFGLPFLTKSWLRVW